MQLYQYLCAVVMVAGLTVATTLSITFASLSLISRSKATRFSMQFMHLVASHAAWTIGPRSMTVAPQGRSASIVSTRTTY